MRLEEFLHSKGFSYSPKLDGSFERFEINGKENNGWLVGSPFSASFGNWATGEKYFWNIQMERDLTGEEQEKLHQDIHEQKERFQREKALRQEEAAKTAKYIWNASTWATAHPYLQKKQVKSHRLKISKTFDLIIPIYNQGELVSLQFIDDKGTKKFLPGGKLSGSYYTIGVDKQEVKKIYLCEGYATGASIREATQSPVIVAFNANNLPKVAEYLKTKNVEVIVCADNDVYTAGNPGVSKAYEAARVTGGQVLIPDFGEHNPEKYTDWNDWHCKYGLESLKEKLMQTSTTNDKTPTKKEAKLPKKEKEKYSEKTHALAILSNMGTNLIRIEKDLFAYNGTHWSELGAVEIDRIKNAINDWAGGSLPSKTVNSIYSTFFRMVPSKHKDEVNLFLPNKTAANFLDGTLHLRRDVEKNIYTYEFLGHNRLDYLNSLISVNFSKIDRTQKNELLDKLLDEVFLNDPDKEDKIKLLQEMAGAILVPTFDQMFFITGVSGSRKSTLIKIFIKMLQEPNGAFKNVSFTDPSNMEGFEIEGMINKLVNVNTDICDNRPLPRGFMKRFADGLPFQVNRKNKSVVNAMLPLLHIYACNDLPPMDEKSDAMQRRISVIEFKNDLTNGQGAAKEIKYYEDVVWKHNPNGIYAFALAGLERILSNGGKFTQIASSSKKVREWREESDMTKQFLEAIEHGEVSGIYLHCDAKIERKKLGDEFLGFVGGSASILGKNAILGVFYKELAKKGYKFSNTMGTRFVYGIGVKGDAGGKPGNGF